MISLEQFIKSTRPLCKKCGKQVVKAELFTDYANDQYGILVNCHSKKELTIFTKTEICEFQSLADNYISKKPFEIEFFEEEGLV